MAGHSSKRDSKKKSGIGSNKADSSGTNHEQNETQRSQQPHLDINEIAKEKVREIETALESQDKSYNFESLDSSLSVLKQIITAADLHRTNDNDAHSRQDQARSEDTGESIYADFSDDNEQFNTHIDLTDKFATNSVKWTIRVQAFKLVHKLIRPFVESIPSPAMRSKSAILKHLSDLISLSFVAATSPYDELKMQGFKMMHYLIDKFAQVEEKEFAGHSILEQYKTQVLSAVKPAFNQDAPPYITAVASQICSLWICQGLEKDPNDVRRTHQLMLMSIEKLESQSMNRNSKLYTESELEQERLDILGSWAQLYLASKELDLAQSSRIFTLAETERKYLYQLVSPCIDSIVDKWWEALKDYALLIMPSPRLIGANCFDDGHVYTKEVALGLFEPNWPKLVLATAIWLCTDSDLHQQKFGENSDCDIVNQCPNRRKRSGNEKYAKFICGIVMKELCKRHVAEISTRLPESTLYTVRTLNLLLSNLQFRGVLVANIEIMQEFYTILYNITVSYARDSHRSLLRKTLDLMFNLALNRIKKDDRSLHFGLVKLVSQIMNAMKDIELASKHGASNLDDARVQFTLRFSNLIHLIKFAPEATLTEPPLLEAVVVVFQELLQFQSEPSFVLSLTEQLNELYTVLPQGSKLHFIESMLPDLCAKGSAMFLSLYSGPPSDEDKIKLSIWDACLRSSQIAITQVETPNRQPLIDRFVSALVENIDIEEELVKSDGSKRKRDLMDASINKLTSLSRAISEDLDDLLSDQVKVKYVSVVKFHKDTKTKLDAKLAHSKTQTKKLPSTGRTKTQAAKITLKADFSNFYAKKA